MHSSSFFLNKIDNNMKTIAENSKTYRIKKGEVLKQKEKERSSLRRTMATAEAKEKAKCQTKERMRKLREKKKIENAIRSPLSTIPLVQLPAFKSRSQEARAKNKVKNALPLSPTKKVAIIKDVALEMGIQLVSSSAVTREKFSHSTKQKVLDFYHRDDISRWTPGKNEFVRVTGQNGEKMTIQKRYIICPLKEAFALFIEQCDGQKLLSFSKFCDLRPKYVLTYRETPLEACCCLQHKNFINLCTVLAQHLPFDPYTSKWIEQYCLCSPITDACRTFECTECAEKYAANFKSRINLEEFQNVELSYPWWTTDDNGRTERIKVVSDLNTVFKLFQAELDSFTIHHLTKRHQAAKFNSAKTEATMPMSNLNVMQFDFSENYTCKYQEGAQSAYWNQAAVSIFTAAVYNQEMTKMVAFVSDKNDHTKTAVTCYLKMLLEIYSKPGQNVQFWSDGPSSQFKNRFMAHYTQMLCEKYQLASLSWNFFATSHGKGAIDGVGGTLKRTVWCKVKSRSADVKNAQEFVEVVKDSKIDVKLVENDDIDNFYSTISESVEAAPKIGGIKSMHHWKSVIGSPLSMHRLSTTSVEIIDLNDELPQAMDVELDAGDYVSAKYNGKLYPGIVLAKTAQATITVKCMEHFAGNNWRWPSKEDIYVFYPNELTKIAPLRARRRGYFEFHQ